MKIALIQQSNTADCRNNTAKLEKNIRLCAGQGAELVVLQELHNNLYFCQNENPDNFELSETIPGFSTRFFGRIASELQLVIVLSLFEKRSAGLYHNTAVVIEKDGSIAGKYRKMHIPDDPAYYEKFYFAPGDLGFKPVQTSVGKLGVLVCWDQWYPEAARIMALHSADLLIYPTAIGWETSDSEEEKRRQFDAWNVAQRAHAVANGLHVVSCNRTGCEKDTSGITNGIEFWGGSFVAGPQGEILAQAAHCEEQNLIAEINLQKTETVRRWWPFFRDRRIDAYGDLLKRWGE